LLVSFSGKEAQEQIFESYYQVEKRDHREGFGLGLSLTRSLIHMHKGEIRVESEINKGSDFIVTLNVALNLTYPPGWVYLNAFESKL